MIKFDINNLHTERLHLKSITTSLGGAMSVVDESRSTNEKEVYRRLNVPFAVARRFIKSCGNITKYYTPIEIEVLYYGDEAVCIERSPFLTKDEEEELSVTGDKRTWTSKISTNLEQLEFLTRFQNNWYIDGKNVFCYFENMEQYGERLSENGKFKAFAVDCINLQSMNVVGDDDISEKNLEQKTCIAYFTDNGKSAVSPPIWGSITMGDRQLTLLGDNVVDGNRFDQIDDNLAVNLNFVLRAAKTIAGLYGYEAIEPLRLDDMMIELKTVNLPNVNSNIKQTYDTGLLFTHAMAWLIGQLQNTTSLKEYSEIAGLMKYLTTKGVYRRQAFNKENVYLKGHDSSSIPLMTKAQALEEYNRKRKYTRRMLHNFLLTLKQIRV